MFLRKARLSGSGMQAVFDLLRYGCKAAITGQCSRERPCRSSGTRGSTRALGTWQKERFLGEGRSVEAGVDKKALKNTKQDVEANPKRRSQYCETKGQHEKKWEGEKTDAWTQA